MLVSLPYEPVDTLPIVNRAVHNDNVSEFARPVTDLRPQAVDHVVPSDSTHALTLVLKTKGGGSSNEAQARVSPNTGMVAIICGLRSDREVQSHPPTTPDSTESTDP